MFGLCLRSANGGEAAVTGYSSTSFWLRFDPVQIRRKFEDALLGTTTRRVLTPEDGMKPGMFQPPEQLNEVHRRSRANGLLTVPGEWRGNVSLWFPRDRGRVPYSASRLRACQGSVDSLPVRLRPRWKDQHRADTRSRCWKRARARRRRAGDGTRAGVSVTGRGPGAARRRPGAAHRS
jgi:hypothetical protein